MDFDRPRVTPRRFAFTTALPLILALAPAPGAAQVTAPVPPSTPAEEPIGAPDTLARPAAVPNMAVAPADGTPLADNEVAFTAASLDYDYKNHIVVATGDVHMLRQGNRLRADKVVWNRDSGQVHASGSVAIQNPQGDVSYGDEVELTDTLKDGVITNMLLVLENGGRMAADKGSRTAGVYTLERAAYTPCDVTASNGCPKEPLWKITAARVLYDPARHRISYRDARLTLLGMPIMWLPSFSHPDGSGEGGNSGLLVPDITYNSRNGLQVATPYYIQLAPNRDLTVTPYLFTGVLPMMYAQYRQLGRKGAFQVAGYGTYSTQSTSNTDNGNRSFRGYIDANGKWQLDPYWSITTSIRAVTDKTFLRRYYISWDDRLRSTAEVARVDDKSYLSISGWVFETLIPGANQKAQPIAIPAIDYRRLIRDPLVGGTITLQANTLAITRMEGQDTQRAFVSAKWEKWLLTPLGQQVTFTAFGRGDLYHSDDNLSTATVIYQGQPGWETRGIVAGAIDIRWPFVGDVWGGTQRITPRVQVVASPHTKNLAIPNEDARAIDLEDSNLFALNRFPGYDRWEDGTRVTYGLEYNLDLPKFSLRSLVGQSYRFSSGSTTLPPGTGLSAKTSDFVGRATIRYGNFLSVTERFRLDRDTLKIRRNEIDATFGSAKTYFQAGYLMLNRHISPSIEDLRDHEEIRLGARVAMFKRWSMFGSTTIDLTNDGNRANANLITNTDLADGFDPVQSRIGLAYEDDCFEASVTWRRDYTEVGDARAGNAVQFRLAFKNLGR